MSDFKVRFLGWSGFLLTKDGSGILIDPYDKQSGDVDGDLVYCTHNHPDHVGGIATFMNRNPEAVLVANGQVADAFKQFSNRTAIARDGESISHGDWELQIIEAKHGFLNDINLGVIVRNGPDSFGHCGDAVTFEGFKSTQLDTLAIPITGLFTASPNRAISELKKFDQPLPTIVVMHWVFRNPSSFCRRLKAELPGATCIVPKKAELLPL